MSFSGTASYPRAVNGDSLLARIAEAPERTAILLDVDGVLAPIVDVPHDSTVPEETRVELRRLNDRYALVACISGRSSADARRVVGLDELVYVGEHGLELEPEAAAWSDRLQSFATTIDWEDVERKPLTVTFHYRRAESESEALTMLEAVAARARHEGLVARFGRKVLELRPPIDAHKGTAVAHLLGERGLERALYAGDDTTDLDAFRAVEALELGVRVAVASQEGPGGAARGRRHRGRRAAGDARAAALPLAAERLLGGCQTGAGATVRSRPVRRGSYGGSSSSAGDPTMSSCRISTSAATTPTSAIAGADPERQLEAGSESPAAPPSRQQPRSRCARSRSSKAARCRPRRRSAARY